MRDFESRRSRLAALPPGARLVYGAFLGFTLLGLASALLLHADGMGFSAASGAAWWRGDEAAMSFPKSYRQLLELTHFHLFTEPVTWLVLAHLYQMGGDDARARAWVPLVTLLAIGLQIALPWLVTYGAAGFSAMLLPCHLVLAAGLGWMAVSPLWEILRGARAPS